MKKILVVDDEESIRMSLRDILTQEGYQISEAKNGKEALCAIKKYEYDVILCDVKMPRLDGMELLKVVSKLRKHAQIIMITAHGNIDMAMESIRYGAFDFIQKPPDLNRLLVSIRNAVDKTHLITETQTLKNKVAKMDEIIGECEPILKVKDTIKKVAPTEARVLISGANGSGKELVAKWLHAYSKRSKAPLVEVNCAAIPAELIESELFGHEKGSFTSAVKQRIGKFETANEGTIFLDEIGDMSLQAQAKVLRVLEENKITRVGSNKVIPINVRVLAATNKDLKKLIKEHKFREDLYHRLSVIIIQVPSLKDRKDDIPLLVQHFAQVIALEYGQPLTIFNKEACKQLQTYDWTGNIRELRNAVERLIIMCGKKVSKKDVENYVS